jgi:CheY-like chemotaxis protein
VDSALDLIDIANQEVVEICKAMAVGDLLTEVVVKSDQDQLSFAIQRMLINLRSSAAKDQFLTTMSHELRTPLNALIGLSSALVSDTTEISRAQKSEYIVAIHGSGQHLLRLVGDVLDFSKLNAGARSLEKCRLLSIEGPNMDSIYSVKLPPLKLLVVDDVPLNLMVAMALLTPKGHTIETAADGKQAVEMVYNNDYDAVLMDVHMPGMDGMETTQTIGNFANKQRAAVPIVALSADVDIKQQGLFIASGMDALVGKPWGVQVLKRTLKRILN